MMTGRVPILGARPIVQWMHDGAHYTAPDAALWDAIASGAVLYVRNPWETVGYLYYDSKAYGQVAETRPARGYEAIGEPLNPDREIVLSGGQTIWIEKPAVRGQPVNDRNPTRGYFSDPIGAYLTYSISGDMVRGGVKADRGFLRDVIKGTLFVAAFVVGGNLAGIGTPAPAPITPAVGPSDWLLATSGMGEGMGTANILATVAPAVPVAAVTPVAAPAVTSTLPTLAQIGSGIQTAVQTVQQTAASIVGVAAAANAVRAAVNTPDTVVPKADESASKTADNTLMYAGVGVLLLLALKG